MLSVFLIDIVMHDLEFPKPTNSPEQKYLYRNLKEYELMQTQLDLKQRNDLGLTYYG